MKKYKRLIKDDLEKNLDVKLEFDVATLETNKKRGFSKYRKNKIIKNSIIGVVCVAFISILCIPILAMMNYNSRTQIYSKKYSQSELSLIEKGSFVKLNEITYPSLSQETKYVSEKYKQAISDFAYKVYENSKSSEMNYIYSPLSLYVLIDIISSGVSNQYISSEIDSVLGLDYESRLKDFKKMYQNDYYANSNGTIQMYNGLFLNNRYEYNETHIDKISEKYTEAFQLDFSNNSDIKQMVNWVNQKVQDDRFITLQDLNLDSDKEIYYFSTLYFNNRWSNVYSDKKSYKGTFYVNNGSTSRVTFMNHSYYGTVYEYEKYYGFYDYYYNGSKIKYLYPKNENDDIFTLLDGVNFIENDEEYLANTPRGDGTMIIDLTVPKFSYSNSFDFSNILSNIGLSKIFDPMYNSLDTVFKNYPSDVGFYVDWIKQKNQINFTEEGTEVRTVSFGAGASDSGYMMHTLSIKLDRPFVYVIYDSNDLPLYIGSVVNPAK